MKKFFAAAAISCFLLGAPTASDAQDHIRIRPGISFVTGLVGVEYQKSQLAYSLGWLRGDEPRIALSARYLLAPEGSGLLGGVTLITNNSNAVVTKDANIVEEYYHLIGATVGYRFSISEQLDLTVGGGYGAYLGVPDGAINSDLKQHESGTAMIDLSIGYTVK